MWREWIYSALSQSVTVTALVPVNRIYGSGALTGVPPSVPFITVGFGPAVPSLRGDDRVLTDGVVVSVWCHDNTGGYKRIDLVLDAVWAAITAAASPGSGYFAVSQGRSADLADDVLDTLKKSEDFLLTRRLA